MCNVYKLCSIIPFDVCSCRFLAVSLDESTTVDMQSRMAMFIHLVENWERKALFVGLPEIQGGGTSSNIFKVRDIVFEA